MCGIGILETIEYSCYRKFSYSISLIMKAFQTFRIDELAYLSQSLIGTWEISEWHRTGM